MRRLRVLRLTNTAITDATLAVKCLGSIGITELVRYAGYIRGFTGNFEAAEACAFVRGTNVDFPGKRRMQKGCLAKLCSDKRRFNDGFPYYPAEA